MSDIEELLQFYPPPIAALAVQLHSLVMRAIPDAVERVRTGWRLIGYDLPNGRKLTYFAWVMPEVEHVHVGWQTGTLMADPDGILRGAHLKLKKVRYLTFTGGDKVPAKLVVDFTREAARLALMPRGERELIAASRRETVGSR